MAVFGNLIGQEPLGKKSLRSWYYKSTDKKIILVI